MMRIQRLVREWSIKESEILEGRITSSFGGGGKE